MKNGKPVRVFAGPQPRVRIEMLTSTNMTAPRVAKSMRLVHQFQTRSNTLISETFTVATPIDDDKLTIKIDNRRISRHQPSNLPSIQPTNFPPQNTKTRKVNSVLIGSKHNNANNILQKYLQKLIDEHLAQDKL